MPLYTVGVVSPRTLINNCWEMQVAVDYPAAWWEPDGQPDSNIPTAPNLMYAEGKLLTPTQADGLQANYVVALLEEMPAEEVQAEWDALIAEHGIDAVMKSDSPVVAEMKSVLGIP